MRKPPAAAPASAPLPVSTMTPVDFLRIATRLQRQEQARRRTYPTARMRRK